MPLPKDPKDMNLDELRMLIEFRKLELKMEFQEVRHSLGLGSRILKAFKNSGILEGIQESFQKKASTKSNQDAKSKEETEPQ
ncbi:MAG: hypothetical protein MH321_10145 [Leptospiraceae bacterium]|nr:hypothetical protein [Leptospiraceae bacterium]